MLDRAGFDPLPQWLVEGYLESEMGGHREAGFERALRLLDTSLKRRWDLLWKLLGVIREGSCNAQKRAASLIKTWGVTCPKGVKDELLAMWSNPACAGRIVALDLLVALGWETFTQEDICVLLQQWRTYPANVVQAIEALGRFSKLSMSTARVIPTLLFLLSSKEPYVGSNAASALSSMKDVVWHYPGAYRHLQDLVSSGDTRAWFGALQVLAAMIDHIAADPKTIDLIEPCVRSEISGVSELAVQILSDCADRGTESGRVQQLLVEALGDPDWFPGTVNVGVKGTPANPRSEAAARVALWCTMAPETPAGRQFLSSALGASDAAARLMLRLSRDEECAPLKPWAADEIVRFLKSGRYEYRGDPVCLISKFELEGADSQTLLWVSEMLGLASESGPHGLEAIQNELRRRGWDGGSSGIKAAASHWVDQILPNRGGWMQIRWWRL